MILDYILMVEIVNIYIDIYQNYNLNTSLMGLKNEMEDTID